MEIKRKKIEIEIVFYLIIIFNKLIDQYRILYRNTKFINSNMNLSIHNYV